MANDLISRAALKDELVKDLANTMRMTEMHKGDMALRVLNRVDEAPSVEAEPVRHGRWIRLDNTFTRWSCSECGAIESHSGYAYCHCGAKMDGGAE